MHTTQYPDLLVKCREGSNMNTGNGNPQVVDDESRVTQNSLSAPLALDSVHNKCYIPPLNDSNSFGIVGYDTHINSKIDYSINHVYKSTTLQILNTLHHVCERTQMLTVEAMSLQNPQFTAYLLSAKLLYLSLC